MLQPDKQSILCATIRHNLLFIAYLLFLLYCCYMSSCSWSCPQVKMFGLCKRRIISLFSQCISSKVLCGMCKLKEEDSDHTSCDFHLPCSRAASRIKTIQMAGISNKTCRLGHHTVNQHAMPENMQLRSLCTGV